MIAVWSRGVREIVRWTVGVSVIGLPWLAAGCGTLENGRGWGQDALWPIDSHRLGKAAHDAFFHPATLVPLAGAAAFAIDDFDERVSDWAVERQPLTGSTANAGNVASYLRNALEIVAFASALATPSGEAADEWLWAKLRGGAVELGALRATNEATGLMKDAAGRERPSGRDDQSFPSGHASASASSATLANRNFGWIDALDDARPILVTTTTAAAGVTAWARVEAGAHYPSDVLVGLALGHFLTAFIHDAFMNLPEDGQFDIGSLWAEDAVGIELRFRF